MQGDAKAIREGPVRRRAASRVGLEWVGLWATLITLTGLTALQLRSSHQEIETTERSRLAHQGRIVEQMLGARLQATANALDALRADVLVLLPQSDGLARLNNRMGLMISSMVGVRTFILVDRAGIGIASNRKELVGLDFHEGERYRTIRSRPDPSELYVSPPFTTPLGNWALSLGRVVLDEHGAFAGYLLAIIDPDYFNLLLDSTRYAPDMSAALTHGGGLIIYRVPEVKGAVGMNLAEMPDALFNNHVRSGERLTAWTGPLKTTGKDALMVFQTIRPSQSQSDGFLVASFTRDTDAMFASWRKELRDRVALLAVIALASSAGLFLLQRRRASVAREEAAREAERERHERSLREKAVELQTILDAVPAAVWIARDSRGTRIDGNRFSAELLRRPPGTNVSVTAPPDERPGNFRPMKDGREIQEDELPVQAAARFGREFRDFEFDIVFDDGTVRHMLGNSSPILGDDGRPKGSVAAFVDITERKQAEARAESLARFPRENPDPVFRLGADQVVLYANDAARRLLGDLAVEEGHVVPEELAEPARRALGTGRRVKAEVDCRGVVFQVSIVPVGAEVNLYAQDITARRAAEDALRKETRRKTEFLAVLSHELRTPLAALRNSITLLDRVPPEGDTARRAREIIHRQSEHLTRLVDDLLDISRISHGKIELRRTRIDVREVVRRLCDDVKHTFEERGIELHSLEPSHPVWIDADAARMTQMIGNLLNNALKFTQPGGQVHVSIRIRGVACEVSVRDDGIGIDPQDLDSVFDPFVQVEPARSGAQGGMGIGLALVRELAISHGGRVHALSEGPGQGTEIVLTLPLALVQKDEGTPAAPAKVQPRTPGLSILLVEDNDDARESLALLLTLNGHEVSVVTTGRAGVEAVSAHPPDVLICDVGLPDLSGFQVIRAIRAAHPSAGVFAIALTGYAQPQDRDQALQSGFDAHLAKPPDFAELDQILSEVVRRKGHATVGQDARTSRHGHS